jgi:hypothetical protein
MPRNNKVKTITNEKPVSLNPLGFREALLAILKVKPKPKAYKTKPNYLLGF